MLCGLNEKCLCMLNHILLIVTFMQQREEKNAPILNRARECVVQMK